MFSWRFKVSDDRGKRVSAFNWRRVDRFRRDLDPGMLCARRADPNLAEAEIGRRMLPQAAILVVVFAAMLLTLGTPWVVVPLVASSILAPLYWRYSGLRLLVRAMRQEGYCPSCAYALKDVPAAHDGCQVCPECGAAWRLTPSTAASAKDFKIGLVEPHTLRPGILADHRGKPVQSYQRRKGLNSSRDARNPDHIAKEAAIDSAVRSLGTTRGVVVMVLVVICVSCLMFTFSKSPLVGGMFALLFVFTAVRLLSWTLGTSSGRVSVALLRARLCASCGYDLEGINFEADGCQVCPECGAAWRLDSSARPDGCS